MNFNTNTIDTNKLYKLSKYYNKIEKSLVLPINLSKLKNYMLHLKYYIYSGGNGTKSIDNIEFQILNSLIEELIKTIENYDNETNNNVSLLGEQVKKLDNKLKEFNELNKLNKFNQNENQNIQVLNSKIKIYSNILNKIKEIIDKIKQEKNNIDILENDKNNILLEIQKLNKDLENKKERIKSLQNKLNENENEKNNIDDILNTSDNDKIIKLNEKSENFKNLIIRFENNCNKIIFDVENKQKEIEIVNKKIKDMTEQNINKLKTQINNLNYPYELYIIVQAIFYSLFETLYGNDIANQIVEK